MTFALAGRCRRTGRLGTVVSSSSPAVGARCAYVRAGVGAALTQNITDPRLGPALLDALAAGLGAAGAVESVRSSAPHAAYRQIAVVDASGHAAAWSGAQVLGTYATMTGDACVAAGNLLSSTTVVEVMAIAFGEQPDADLGDRLMAALRAAQAAGGEAGQVRSAALLVAGSEPWPVTDLRVDWDDDPVERLAALWRLWAPQADDYVARALDPGSAPSYGVAGDE